MRVAGSHATVVCMDTKTHFVAEDDYGQVADVEAPGFKSAAEAVRVSTGLAFPVRLYRSNDGGTAIAWTTSDIEITFGGW